MLLGFDCRDQTENVHLPPTLRKAWRFLEDVHNENVTDAICEEDAHMSETHVKKLVRGTQVARMERSQQIRSAVAAPIQLLRGGSR